MYKNLSLTVFFSGAVLFLGTAAMASNEVCKSLPTLTKNRPSKTDIKSCHRKVNGRVFDYNALMICRNMNTISTNGASARDINKCLDEISGRQYNAEKLKQCAHGRQTSGRVIRCVKSSSV